MEGLTFRLGQSTDFHEILKISEGIYEGHDYLPKRYHTWMEMENWNVMLAFSGDKLSSLVAFAVVDEGKTYVTRAARTLQEFRGQGIYKALLKAVTGFIRSRFSTVSRQRLAAHGKHAAYQSFRPIGFQDSLACFVKEATLRPQKRSFFESVQVESCTQEYLCDVLFSPTVAEKLFPHNIINIDYFPIEPFRSNIDYLLKEYGDVYFAVEKSLDNINAPPRSVSFGVFSPRVAYTHWKVSIYADDPMLFEAHLLHQFKHACRVIQEAFLFATLHDKRFTKCGRSVLTEILKVEIEEDWSSEAVHLYEISV
ncbi:histidine N-acetyltransferase-like [Montipora foliosa]|uniref:histidine N-acetyltransferase-like n=1 Tax=Montipora foliosa TaxID=591990 RepID=UPI0035F1768A